MSRRKYKLTKNDISFLVSQVKRCLWENSHDLHDGLSEELSSTNDKMGYVKEYEACKKWYNEILEKLKSL